MATTTADRSQVIVVLYSNLNLITVFSVYMRDLTSNFKCEPVCNLNSVERVLDLNQNKQVVFWSLLNNTSVARP